MQPTDQEFAALMRVDLALFIERAFVELVPGTRFLPNWHIDLIASKLEAVLAGRITRLIINVPPRSLKSLMSSVAFVAWALGHRPTYHIICASYGQDLADALALDCRRIMQSAWYQRLFPTRLTAPRPAVHDLRTTAGGGRFATSVGGVLTGRGGDVIIIDDPLKPDEAHSESARRTANDWLDNTVRSRFNDQQTGAMIIIMQRLHMDDLVGHVLEQEAWDVVALPAIAEAEERWVIESVRGRRTVLRHPGDCLHPERDPREVLEQQRATLGEYLFAAQYLQAPVPLGGAIVKTGWFQQYEPTELPTSFDQIVQSWDTANSPRDLANPSVCTTWGRKGKGVYLLHVYRQRVDYPDLKRAVIALAAEWKPAVILIEDKASGTQLVQELAGSGVSGVKAVTPKGDKIMRLHEQTIMIERGDVWLPRRAAWLHEYIAELTSFPQCKHSDQVDSTTQALGWIAETGVEPHMLTWIKQECARLGIAPPAA
jgi:predicted phage terminase large subunit-like protein